jgi:inner membrane protein
MDNFSHSLTGISIAAGFQAPSPQARRLFMAAGVLSANLPDLDLICSALEPGRLSYMVEHRGLSHALVFTPTLALLLMAGFYGWTRWRKFQLKLSEWVQLFLICVLGLLSHIMMDFSNSYGIHLFAPFDNRWQYGDILFIIEPWLWVCCLPLFFAVCWPRLKYLVIGFVGMLIGGAIYVKLMSPYIAATMLVCGFLIDFVSRRLSLQKKSALALGAFMIIAGIFGLCASNARRSLTANFDASRGFELKDLVLSPRPGNPMCWTYFTIERNQSIYRVIAGTYQLAPDWIDQFCGEWKPANGVSLSRVTQSSFLKNPAIREFGEYQTNIETLMAGADTQCLLKEWLTFARVPYRVGNIVTDLRFGIRSADNFTTLDVSPQSRDVCLSHPSPWVPPFRPVD